MSDAADTPAPPRRRRLSGKTLAIWLIACFALTAILIPMVLRFPRWIEFEIVLGVWWVVWLAILTRLLYRGHTVSDDHQYREPRNWLGGNKPQESPDRKQQAQESNTRSWWDGFFNGMSNTPTDGEGCLVAVGIVIALVLLFGLLWFLIELAIPVLFTMLYLLTRGMLASVLNDRHGCQGSVPKALAWGFVWATTYTAPLAVAVWFIHFVFEKFKPAA